MKICIDARSPGYSGGLTYASGLLRKLFEADTKNEYLILSDYKGAWKLNGAEERVLPSNNPAAWMIWSNTTLPKVLEAGKIDLYHSLKHVTLFRGRTKKVATFLSARLFLYPRQFKWYDFAYWRTVYPAAAKKYDRVIVFSEAEKKLYAKHIGVPEAKFRVIHLAVDTHRFRVIQDANKLQKAKEKWGLPERFLLYVGRLEPVKNIEAVIKAYDLAKKQKKIDHQLVIVGKESWHSAKLFSLVKELGIASHVLFTGPIFDELPCVYNLADLFLFPSHYEAFPQVPLEAMACGIPVIASNRGGIPEAVGEAGILVSPTNIPEIADGIILLLSNNQLRESIIQKGFTRPPLFTWERCATDTLKVYEELGYG